MRLRSRVKKLALFSLVFLFIFSTALTTVPNKEVSAAQGYRGKIYKHWTRLRAGKSKNSKVLKRLEVGTSVTVYETSGDWSKVSTDGKTGYVPKEYVYIEATGGYKGKIFRHWTRLRTGQSKNCKVLKRLEVGTPVTVYKTTGNWRKISVDGKTGYVPKQYVYISTKAPALKGSTYDKGKQVASFAQRFVGNSYVWGGTDLNRGADCSGFIGSVYRSFGYSLPRSSGELRSAGRKVSYSNKQPGDIICYDGHVAMYIGDGKIVHASNRKTGIKISPRANYRRVICVRRIVK